MHLHVPTESYRVIQSRVVHAALRTEPLAVCKDYVMRLNGPTHSTTRKLAYTFNSFNLPNSELAIKDDHLAGFTVVIDKDKALENLSGRPR